MANRPPRLRSAAVALVILAALALGANVDREPAYPTKGGRLSHFHMSHLGTDPGRHGLGPRRPATWPSSPRPPYL